VFAADPSPLLQQWYDFVTQPGRADIGGGLKVRAWMRARASRCCLRCLPAF
jgi:hypothetical protein